MTAVDFVPYGPFAVSYERGAKTTTFDKALLWSDPAAAELMNGRGCYILVAKRGKSMLPFYVGLTRATFGREIFTPSNIRKYHAALAGGKKYAVSLFLIEHPESKKSSKPKFIGELEDFFISTAFVRNPALRNRKGRPQPKWRVPHVTAPAKGKPTQAARALRKAMGFSDTSHHPLAGRAFKAPRKGTT